MSYRSPPQYGRDTPPRQIGQQTRPGPQSSYRQERTSSPYGQHAQSGQTSQYYQGGASGRYGQQNVQPTGQPKAPSPSYQDTLSRQFEQQASLQLPTDEEEDEDSDEEDFYETLPVNVKRVVQGILGVELAQTNIRKQFQKEVFALEAKYAAKYQSLNERRKRVIAGSISVTSKEVSMGEAESRKDDEDYESLPPANPIAVHIPDFCLRVLQSHPGIWELISERDEDALKSLVNIDIAYYPNNLSFAVNFYFGPNEFFTNSVLTKTYFYKDELSFFGTLLYSHVRGDQIHWKGRSLIDIPTPQKINMSYDQTRLGQSGNLSEEEDAPDELFFNYFNPPAFVTIPSNDIPKPQKSIEEDDDEEEEDRDEILVPDFEIGEALKDRIIPHAVEYFTGRAWDYEDDNDDDYDDNEDEDEDEDEGSE